jgi:hypothetical protein
MRVGDPITIEMGDMQASLIIDQLQLDRGADAYRVQGVSPIMRQGQPWAGFTQLEEAGLASEACRTVLGEDIDWELTDWALPASVLQVRAAPLDIARQIAGAVGGVIESRLDGSLVARMAAPVSPDAYHRTATAASLSDDDLVSRADMIGASRRANRYVISSGSDFATQGFMQYEVIPVPDAQEDATRRLVRAYPDPWSEPGLAHTGDETVQISPAENTVVEHFEVVAIVQGRCMLRYPVARVIEAGYQHVDLGEFTIEGREVKTAEDGYSQLAIRYESRVRVWQTVSEIEQTVQFLMMDPVT